MKKRGTNSAFFIYVVWIDLPCDKEYAERIFSAVRSHDSARRRFQNFFEIKRIFHLLSYLVYDFWFATGVRDKTARIVVLMIIARKLINV